VAVPVVGKILAWLFGVAVTSYVASKNLNNIKMGDLGLPQGSSLNYQLNVLLTYGMAAIVAKIAAIQSSKSQEQTDEGTSDSKEAEGSEKDKSKVKTPTSNPEDYTKLKGNQGWKDKDGNTWKKDQLHKDHWDISNKKGKKIKEVDFDGNEIWPNGPKNKNKSPK